MEQARPLAAMTQRVRNATAHLTDVLRVRGELTAAQADVASAYYLKHRIAALDPQVGRATFKHGAFLERDVIRRAAGL